MSEKETKEVADEETSADGEETDESPAIKIQDHAHCMRCGGVDLHFERGKVCKKCQHLADEKFNHLIQSFGACMA